MLWRFNTTVGKRNILRSAGNGFAPSHCRQQEQVSWHCCGWVYRQATVLSQGKRTACLFQGRKRHGASPRVLWQDRAEGTFPDRRWRAGESGPRPESTLPPMQG